jgi:hypothetical protein
MANIVMIGGAYRMELSLNEISYRSVGSRVPSVRQSRYCKMLWAEFEANDLKAKQLTGDQVAKTAAEFAPAVVGLVI